LRKLVLVVVAGLGMAGCGGGAAHHTTASTPTNGRTGSVNGPLPSGSPIGDSAAGMCSAISYRITSAGVEITAKVARTPATINFEADDKDDNPVTGDPDTSGTTYAFKGNDTQHDLMIKGVRSLDHLTVIALGTSNDDSCRADRR
jgi:hypothetical protein